MSPTRLAQELGVTKGMVSQWLKKGMPTESVEAAQAWRLVHAPPRNRPKAGNPAKPASPLPESPADLIPPPEDRHHINGIDDQGESDGDQANNPYDALRQAKLAEKKAWDQLAALSGRTDAIEYAKSQASFIQAQRHRMWMQGQVRQWAKEQSVTLYVEEAKALYLQALQGILRHLDLLGPKTAPLCTDPKAAKDAIENGVNKLRVAVRDLLEGRDDAGSEEA